MVCLTLCTTLNFARVCIPDSGQFLFAIPRPLHVSCYRESVDLGLAQIANKRCQMILLFQAIYSLNLSNVSLITNLEDSENNHTKRFLICHLSHFN